MITFRTATVLALALIPSSASVQADKLQAVLHSATSPSCFAICEHPSHGEYGWLGPLRTGAKGASRAANDATAHNEAYPGHTASTDCN